MLMAVRKFWIEGVLESSLYEAALIELGMEERREAVNYPWNYTIDRVFLRKVGGGYIFIHRYLMEYFASLEGNNN
jgi:hypothetical protein